jgi:hypothetical protein
MADAESLARELRGRGYNCPTGQTAEGKVSIIQHGPNGEFDPPAEVHFRIPRFPDNGGIQWTDAGGRLHRETLEISDAALAEAVIASIEIINPA